MNFPADPADVLHDELSAIHHRRRILANNGQDSEHAPGELTEPEEYDGKVEAYDRKVDALDQPLSALCLSGGGIRSAAFALGVVQGLAAKGVLRQFDYLSTVSGGGYTGGFLTAWVQRAGYEAVEKELKTGAPEHPTQKSPLRHLRAYSSYLTPRTGLLTADTLTVVALYVRNLLLNWLIIIPIILCVLLLVKMGAITFWLVSADASRTTLLLLVSGTLIGVAVIDSLQRRPGWENATYASASFHMTEMLPVLAGGMLASCAILGLLQRQYSKGFDWDDIAVLGPLAAVFYFICAAVSFSVAPPPPKTAVSTGKTVRTAGLKHQIGAFAAFTIGGLVVGFSLGLASRVFAMMPDELKPFAFLALGPPVLFAALFAGELLHVGLSSYTPWGDGEREWLARAAGQHGRAAAVWMAVITVVFGGSYATFWLTTPKNVHSLFVATGLTGSAAGIIVALLGKASTTAATIREKYNSWLNWSAATILAIATPVFIVVTISFMSAGMDWLITGEALGHDGQKLNPAVWLAPPETLWAALQADHPRIGILLVMFGSFAVLSALAFAASFFINTNRFSMHGVYRNRLIRAFLGASKGISKEEERRPNRDTDFADEDNINLAELWPNARKRGRQPPQFLVVNMALNVVATKDLAWQERKALSFTATPRWIGYGGTKLTGRGHYRLTFKYGGASENAKKPDALWDQKSGMSLGTAMTISGAAASPNMGYHSSPALSLLLTFFNVRLGAWLGNPAPAGADVYMAEGPVIAALPLIHEGFGLTTEDRGYVYLSDGGHFENLGIYEMVRRRCRLIVVSDAGSDPKGAFDDLGNAVRKISIDLNIEIKFRALTIAGRKEPPEEGPYWAVADIHYPSSSVPGTLIYLKPGYQGIEPVSVRSYASANPAFPHESTADQWFGESQFEAYRALGKHIIETIDGEPAATYGNVKEFVDAAANRLARAGKMDT